MNQGKWHLGPRSPDLWPAELLGPRTDTSPAGDLLDWLLGDAALARAAIERITRGTRHPRLLRLVG